MSQGRTEAETRVLRRAAATWLRLASTGFTALVLSAAGASGDEVPADTLQGPKFDLEAAETPKGPDLPPVGLREVADAPLAWHSISSTMVTIDPRTRWLLFVEECTPGYVTVEGDRRPLRQTRIKITIPEGKPVRAGKVLGYVMHLSNTECALLAPDDPRVGALPSVIDDKESPWPNTCGIEVMTTEHPIDLDRDYRQEVALKRYATIGSRAGRGLLLLEANDAGEPRLAPLSSIVRGIRADALQLTDIQWLGKDLEPTLFVEHQGLEECRFLAEIGIRGERQCSDCCQVTILLQRATDLFYYPNYLRGHQAGQLDRLRSDLKEISTGDPGQPLSSEQEASLARAAAFLYLTGSASRSRSQLVDVLGVRATQFRPQLLLERLERYFTPVDTMQAKQGPAPNAPPQTSR